MLPSPLPPGTPLPGGGVAGRILYTWTDPPQIVWQGWLTADENWQPPTEFASTQLQTYFPEPSADAPPQPDGGRWTVIRVLPPGGWCSRNP